MPLSKAQIAILPNLGEVLYEPASKDREAKKCGNCALWSLDKRCALFGDRSIFSWDGCGYHVDGAPRAKRIRLKMAPLDPKLAGLGFYPRGTRCGRCAAFQPGKSNCNRVRDFWVVKLAVVDSFGCCTRYSGR